MSCKGALQKWLGVDEFYRLMKKWVNARVTESESEINEINSKVRALMAAGADVESALNQLDTSNSNLHSEHIERIDVLRNAIQETRNEGQGLRATVAQQNAEITQLQQSINRLEHPGYEKIG